MTKEQRRLIEHWLMHVRWYACPFETMLAIEDEMEKAGITQSQINEVALRQPNL